MALDTALLGADGLILGAAPLKQKCKVLRFAVCTSAGAALLLLGVVALGVHRVAAGLGRPGNLSPAGLEASLARDMDSLWVVRSKNGADSAVGRDGKFFNRAHRVLAYRRTAGLDRTTLGKCQAGCVGEVPTLQDGPRIGAQKVAKTVPDATVEAKAAEEQALKDRARAEEQANAAEEQALKDRARAEEQAKAAEEEAKAAESRAAARKAAEEAEIADAKRREEAKEAEARLAREAEAKAKEAEARAKEAEAKAKEAEARLASEKVEAEAKAKEAEARLAREKAEAEAKAREAEAEAKAKEADARAKEAEAKAKEAEVRLAREKAEAEAKAKEAEARAKEAEAKAKEAAETEAKLKEAEAKAKEADAKLLREAEARAKEAEAKAKKTEEKFKRVEEKLAKDKASAKTQPSPSPAHFEPTYVLAAQEITRAKENLDDTKDIDVSFTARSQYQLDESLVELIGHLDGQNFEEPAATVVDADGNRFNEDDDLADFKYPVQVKIKAKRKLRSKDKDSLVSNLDGL